jgi:hypothetical protein
MHNIFPFELAAPEGTRLFIQYVVRHGAELKEKYGELRYTGCKTGAGYEQCWSWRSVIAVVKSPTEVEFTTFGDDDNANEVINVAYPAEALGGIIKTRKLRHAEHELALRELAQQAEARRLAVAAVHQELFGEAP